MGLDMKKIESGINRNSFELKDEEFEKGEYTNIGYDLFTSKTYFSKGYKVKTERYKKLSLKS